MFSDERGFLLVDTLLGVFALGILVNVCLAMMQVHSFTQEGITEQILETDDAMLQSVENIEGCSECEEELDSEIQSDPS